MKMSGTLTTIQGKLVSSVYSPAFQAHLAYELAENIRRVSTTIRLTEASRKR